MDKLKSILTLMAFMMATGQEVQACVVDMKALAMIESSNNPKAYNKKSKATGLYQITPICLKDYNRCHKGKLTMADMKDPKMCEHVAVWYLQDRIASFLTWMKLPVTTQRVLWAWNAGIAKVADGIMPEETRKFINRYNQIARRTHEGQS